MRLSEQIAQYVTAYSGDLKDESLDGQRVVMGGIVTGLRTVVTRNKETMAVATLEDLQGTLEVVVFPRMYATSGGTFAEGAILLVAGRVDHRGEEASLLADAVWVWEDAVARGPATIAQEVAAGERSRGGGRRLAAATAGQRQRRSATATGTAPGTGSRRPRPRHRPRLRPRLPPAASAPALVRGSAPPPGDPRLATARRRSDADAGRRPRTRAAACSPPSSAAAARHPGTGAPSRPSRSPPCRHRTISALSPRIARSRPLPDEAASRCGPRLGRADGAPRGTGLRHPERALHPRRRHRAAS